MASMPKSITPNLKVFLKDTRDSIFLVIKKRDDLHNYSCQKRDTLHNYSCQKRDTLHNYSCQKRDMILIFPKSR